MIPKEAKDALKDLERTKEELTRIRKTFENLNDEIRLQNEILNELIVSIRDFHSELIQCERHRLGMDMDEETSEKGNKELCEIFAEVLDNGSVLASFNEPT